MAAQSGIGIKLSLVDSKLRIDGVMDRGPAFNSGIRAGWYFLGYWFRVQRYVVQVFYSLDFVERFSGILFLSTGLTYQSALPALCSRFSWALLGASPAPCKTTVGTRLTSFRSIVNLRISRQRGGPVESFDVVRNYSSSVLGHKVSGHQETQLEESLVRDASISLFLQQQQPTVSATFCSDSALSSEIVRRVVQESIASEKAATAPVVAPRTSAALAIVPSFTGSKKNSVPVSPSFNATLQQSQSNSWCELQREQLQRATRCCGELLQLASHNGRQIHALKALCEQRQQELQESKACRLISCAMHIFTTYPTRQAQTATALSRVAALERRAGAHVPAGELWSCIAQI